MVSDTVNRLRAGDWPQELAADAGLKWDPGQPASDKPPVLTKQIGGNHYKHFKIEPVQFILENNLGFVLGNVIKYVCRAPFKGGLEDLLKAQHYLEMLIEQEKQRVTSAAVDHHQV